MGFSASRWSGLFYFLICWHLQLGKGDLGVHSALKNGFSNLGSQFVRAVPGLSKDLTKMIEKILSKFSLRSDIRTSFDVNFQQTVRHKIRLLFSSHSFYHEGAKINIDDIGALFDRIASKPSNSAWIRNHNLDFNLSSFSEMTRDIYAGMFKNVAARHHFHGPKGDTEGVCSTGGCGSVLSSEQNKQGGLRQRKVSVDCFVSADRKVFLRLLD